MEKQIQELWVKNEIRETYVPVNVISTFKAMFSHTENNVTDSSETLMALCYFDETGEILIYPLNETIIKTLYDEKNRESICFSQPDYEAGESEKNR